MLAIAIRRRASLRYLRYVAQQPAHHNGRGNRDENEEVDKPLEGAAICMNQSIGADMRDMTRCCHVAHGEILGRCGALRRGALGQMELNEQRQ